MLPVLPLQVRLVLFFAELADFFLQDEINALVLFVWLQQLPRACFRHNVTKKKKTLKNTDGPDYLSRSTGADELLNVSQCNRF